MPIRNTNVSGVPLGCHSNSESDSDSIVVGKKNTSSNNYGNDNLRNALYANRSVKIKIFSELERISRRKRDNRLEAERCIERSCAIILRGESGKKTTVHSATMKSAAAAAAAASFGTEKGKKIAGKKRKKNNNKIPTSHQVSSLFVTDNNNVEESKMNTNDDDNNKKEEKKEKDDNDDNDNKKGTNSRKLVTNINNNERIWSSNIRKKFRYDPHRKWDLEYFTDPTGSRPKDNEDTIRRHAFMMKSKFFVDDNDDAIATATATVTVNEMNSNNTAAYTNTINGRATNQEREKQIPDTFFHHTSQPFTCQEKSRLDKWLLRKSSSNSSSSNADNTDTRKNFKNFDASDDDDDRNSDSSYYENIAQRLREEHHENPAKRKRDKSLLSTAVPRTAEDIRMYHRHRITSEYKFSKRQSLIILECVANTATQPALKTMVTSNPSVATREDEDKQSHFENADNDNRAQKEPIKPDWETICSRVLEEHHRAHSAKKSTNNDDNRPSVFLVTPYQCMVHYKTKLRQLPTDSFTPEEDELLLRYIAAMGPQYMWGYPQIANLASRLFPYKSKEKIYHRTHWTQWHPLSKDTKWTKEEEMKLVLAMKIYTNRIEDNTSSSNNGDDAKEKIHNQAVVLEKAAVRRVTAHFHPIRQPYKVAKKWERSFSPRFSYRPFSKEEDSKLLEVVRSLEVSTPFSIIAKEYFTDRSTDQLSQRWSKIAPDKDVVEKLVPSLVHSGVKRGLVARTGMTSIGEVANGSKNPAAMFDPSDFVVELTPTENEDKYQQDLDSNDYIVQL